MIVLIIKYLLAAIFALAVLGKLTGKTKSTFENAGLSPVVMYLTAAGEMIGVIGLFTPFAVYATLVLIVFIAGAIGALLKQKALPKKYFLALTTLMLLALLLALQILNY